MMMEEVEVAGSVANWTPFATLSFDHRGSCDEISEISNVSSTARASRRNGLDGIKEITIVQRGGGPFGILGGGGGGGGDEGAAKHSGPGTADSGILASRKASSGDSRVMSGKSEEGLEVAEQEHDEFVQEATFWERNLLLHENVETVLLGKGVFTIQARRSGGGFAGFNGQR